MQYTSETWPTERWPHFSFDEMKCKHSGRCDMDEAMMDKLEELRVVSNFGLAVTSGYRDKTHPIEAKKIAEGSGNGGAHTTGKAVDLAVSHKKAYIVLREAMRLGFTGIGVKQAGDARFLHLDTIGDQDDFHVPRPTLWSY